MAILSRRTARSICYFLQQADLPQVVMGMFDNALYVAVISTVFFFRKVFP